jgi:hypothetical protein
VSEQSELFWIRISDAALETIILSAIEAYVLGDGQAKPRREIETMGLLWGTQKSASDASNGRKVIFIESAVQSLSAQRSEGSVLLHEDAPHLMDSVLGRWAPQKQLLGHFHSHPYRNITEVKDCNGYLMSDEDFRFMKDGNDADFYWKQATGTPVMLAITVCKLGRVRETLQGRNTSWNRFQFDLGNFRFWLNAVVGLSGNGSERTTTRNSCDDRQTLPQVFLDLETKFYNERSARLTRA